MPFKVVFIVESNIIWINLNYVSSPFGQKSIRLNHVSNLFEGILVRIRHRYYRKSNLTAQANKMFVSNPPQVQNTDFLFQFTGQPCPILVDKDARWQSASVLF